MEHDPFEENYGGGHDEDHYSQYTMEEEEDDIQSTATFSAGGDMASMIAAAAAKRTQRIDRGGEKKMRSHEPPRERAPDKQDFASMAAAAAAQRHDRIEASGGALQITQVREIPEEHANLFVNIAEEAANLGRLVRSNEHVVEAESNRIEEKDAWNGPGGLRNQESRRSMFERAISEAAAMGRMKLNKHDETTNYPRSIIEEEEADEIDIDKQVDEHGRRALRTHFLLDQHVREEYREKKTQWDLTESIDMHEYASIDDVELPTQNLPSFKPKDIKYMSQREALEAISSAVAVGAWERNYRLQRPKAQLRVTRGCKCPYCKNPNAFQTHKYKEMASGESDHNDAPPHVAQHTPGHNMEPDENLQPLLPRPEGKIYQMPGTHQGNTEDDIDNDKEDDMPKPKGVWKPPPPTLKQSEPQSTPINIIYETQPDGSLQPIPLPEKGVGAEQPTGYYHSSYHTGTKVLLNETVDFGTRHKRVHIKREKKTKEKEQKKGKTKKTKEQEGCVVM